MDSSGKPPLDERQRTIAWLAYLFLPITSVFVLALARPAEKFARWHAIHAFALGLMVWAAMSLAFVLVAGSWATSSGPAVLAFRTLPILLSGFIIFLMFAAYRGKKWGAPGLVLVANRLA